MTTVLRFDQPFEGHIDVETLAGSASLTINRHGSTPWGPMCLEAFSVMLDPDQVLELATTLTRAAVPPPPTVVRRVKVRRGEDLIWVVECPECIEVDRWHEHGFALEVALRHVQLHTSERAA